MVVTHRTLEDAVTEVKRRARFDTRIFSFTVGKTPNFTNHLEVVQVDGQRFMVKTPKLVSEPIYFGKSVLDFCKGRGFVYHRDRMAFEFDILSRLRRKNVLVPNPVPIELPNVLVTEYNGGEETKLFLRKPGYERVLQQLAYNLRLIHDEGIHGEASTNNTYVSSDCGYWCDFERFTFEASHSRRALEVAYFCRSSARHSYRSIEAIVPLVLEAYDCGSVSDDVPKLLNVA